MTVRSNQPGVVMVAVHDGFYGCGTGAGQSNRAFLRIVAGLLAPAVRLAVLPVRLVPGSSEYDPAWHQQTLAFLGEASADVVPVDNGTAGLTRFGGLGLGLTICARLVAMMRGEIWVDSVPEKGSCFHFTVLLGVPAEMSKAVPPLTQASQSILPLQILLAEDNTVNQRLAQRILEKASHVVVIAENGKVALRWLEEQPFDLIVMDVQMPEMDGIEATAHIRAKEKHTGGHIPIIAMTAHAMEGDRERCLEAGMDGYLSKPIAASALLDMVAEFGAPDGTFRPI